MTDNTQPEALRDARWYMVDKDGMATLCTDREDAEQEAKDANMAWPHTAPHRAVQLVEVGTAAAELRRQHARIVELESRVQELGAMARENRSRRIAELEAQLASIGAGGVSGPLMGQTDSKEREDFERWARDRGYQRDELDRCRIGIVGPEYYNANTEMAWQAFQAGRASLAANAGSEPVAPSGWREAIGEIRAGLEDSEPSGYDNSGYRAFAGTVLDAVEDALTELVTHPSPPEGTVGVWTALPGALPEPGTPVLLDIGKKYPIRAMWAAKFTLPVSLEDDSGFGEHDERTDEWYCPEGWYEWNECEDTHWAVNETPSAWMPLPPTSSADSRKGE